MIVLGHPGHRRVTEFAAAAARVGRPLTVVAHVDAIADPSTLLAFDERPRIVRIDSFGEDLATERSLLALGRDDAEAAGVWTVDPKTIPIAYGEVVAPSQASFGLKRHLQRLAEVFRERPSWRILQPPAAIADLFDKRACWRRHHAAKLPVPEACKHPLADPDELRTHLKVRGWRGAFVKLACGSSASGVAIYDRAQETLTTSLTNEQGRWFNALKLARYRGREQVDPVLRFLLEQGAHVERVVEKARRDGRFLDLRVLVVDGVPAFVVERQSVHPITNLHLGGRRGDVDALRALVPEPAWDAILTTARGAAELHGCFHLGVDVALLRDFEDHMVIEANAFGDLLPGLRRDGRSVYEWQLARCFEGRA